MLRERLIATIAGFVWSVFVLVLVLVTPAGAATPEAPLLSPDDARFGAEARAALARTALLFDPADEDRARGGVYSLPLPLPWPPHAADRRLWQLDVPGGMPLFLVTALTRPGKRSPPGRRSPWTACSSTRRRTTPWPASPLRRRRGQAVRRPGQRAGPPATGTTRGGGGLQRLRPERRVVAGHGEQRLADVRAQRLGSGHRPGGAGRGSAGAAPAGPARRPCRGRRKRRRRPLWRFRSARWTRRSTWWRTSPRAWRTPSLRPRRLRARCSIRPSTATPWDGRCPTASTCLGTVR